MKISQQLHAKHLETYMQQVTKIKLPFTLGSLEAKKKDMVDEMERKCAEELGPNKAGQSLSAQFIDSEGEPVLFYFGDRILLGEGGSQVSEFFG